MSKSLEVELKFEILDNDSLQLFLNNLNLHGQKRVKDIYLDTADGDLFKKGVFIRIRNGKTLDFKFNPDQIDIGFSSKKADHTHCDEYNFNLPLSRDSLNELNEVSKRLKLKSIKKADLEEFKKANKLTESVVVDRQRSSYHADDFEILFDEVENLGNYLEIEYIGSDLNDIENIKKEMREILKSLRLRFINTGYNELYWRKHNFDLYLQGKYLLDEDFEKYRK